jgi:hypothetical protein
MVGTGISGSLIGVKWGAPGDNGVAVVVVGNAEGSLIGVRCGALGDKGAVVGVAVAVTTGVGVDVVFG